MKGLVFVLLILISNVAYSQGVIDNFLKQTEKKYLNIKDNPKINSLSRKITKDSLNAKHYFERAKAYYSLWLDSNKKDSSLLYQVRNDLFKSIAIDSLNAEINMFIASKSGLPDSSSIYYYNRIISHSKKKEEYYFHRAFCLMRLGSFESAISDLNDAIQLAKKRSDIVMSKEMTEDYISYRGLCYAKLKQFELAENDLKSSIKSNSTKSINSIYLGIVKSMQGHYDEALSIYNDLLERVPFVVITYLFKGNIYHEQGNESLANENWSHAIDSGVKVNEKAFNIQTQLDYFIDSFRLGY